MGILVLVTGGARSGKSRFADKLAPRLGSRVVYLATLEPGDEEMRRRVEAHRASRPEAWHTVEEPLDLTGALSRAEPYDVCVLDCLTLWVSNLLMAMDVTARGDKALEHVLERVGDLLGWHQRRQTHLIVVSNEVGGGLVPEYPLGRLFRDALGEANQLVAAAADEVYLCVAGFALDVKRLGLPIR